MNEKKANGILDQCYSSEIGYHWQKKEAEEHLKKLEKKRNNGITKQKSLAREKKNKNE